MRIYTRTGDGGDTGLYGGQRVRKDDIRVETYGTVDEVNALLGTVVALAEDGELCETVLELQRGLFTLGSDLATPLTGGGAGNTSRVPRITAREVERLENLIDCFEATLPSLTHFILPGGTATAASLHQARAVARRAERCLVSLRDAAGDSVNPETLPYLNRLADLLFVLARAANYRAGVADVLWSP